MCDTVLFGSACARSPWDRPKEAGLDEGKFCGVL